MVLDFGYANDPRITSSIHDLGEYVLNRKVEIRHNTIVLAQTASYNYLCEKSPVLARSGRLFEIDVEQSGTKNGAGVRDGGSYFVLKRAYEMATVLDIANSPYDVCIVAHKLHMPRALRQAKLVGFSDAVACSDVPSKLYRDAAQWWCRHRLFWYLRETIGFLPLKIAGQI